MAFEKLSGFDIKAICVFKPTSAKKQDGLLTMDIKISKLSSAQIDISKHCSKTNTPLYYGFNVSQYSPEEKRTHGIGCILTCVDPSTKEYEIKIGMSDFEKSSITFRQDLLIQFSIIMHNFGMFSALANGADLISIKSAFEELVEDGDGAECFGPLYKEFKMCWAATEKRFSQFS